MKIVYTGPHSDGVTIAATGQQATPGVPIDVADDVADRLLEQDVWAEAETEPAAPVKKPGRQSPAGEADPAARQED